MTMTYDPKLSKSGQYYSKFINMKFGALLILDLIYDINKTGRSRYQFICKCDCGTVKNIPCWYILDKGTKSCGCLMHKRKNDYESYIGKKYGYLYIKELVHLKLNNDKYNRAYFIADCDCGTKNKYIPASDFITNNYQSCGCLQRYEAQLKYKSLIGTTQNELTIIDYIYDPTESGRKKHKFKCKCQCGNDQYLIQVDRWLYTNPIRCPNCLSSKAKKSLNSLIEYCSSNNLKLLDDFKNVSHPILNSNNNISTIRTKYHFQCLKCNHIFESTISPDCYLACPNCNKQSVSTAEQLISKFLNENNVYYTKKLIPSLNTNIQNLIEIDFFLPDYNIGIEMHGLHVHASSINQYSNYFIGKKPYNYHLNKLESAIKFNIELLQFWNSELYQTPDIVYSLILNKLHKSKYHEYARNCKIRELSKSEYDNFMNTNHIQKTTTNETIRIGLYYKTPDNIVSAMSFGYDRYGSKCEYELYRFANYVYCNIPGAASKLFNYFIKTYSPKSIISYSDRRLFDNGKLYEILGFKLDHVSKPNYWYFNRYLHNSSLKLLHRSNFQKHMLKDKLKTFDPNLTEVQNMENNGYLRVFDCGNKVYLWQR